ncbi:Chitinase 6 [Acorus calamus]|uniref:chitinase n=1 Tax=Acorus calamus TaxID=4465 RepID=A0AAV9CZF8_ACOCL|nr:Chitinase 6 [Acorus calamus]
MAALDHDSPSLPGSSVASIVTPQFFNGIINQAGPNCPGKHFYTRRAILDALRSYPRFGTTGSETTRKEGDGRLLRTCHTKDRTSTRTPISLMRYKTNVQETNEASHNYCDKSFPQYPCLSNKGYYGRGPLQIMWNFNYGSTGGSIRFDGLRAPETVAKDPVISFKTAFWFWMKNVHSIITAGRGFRETIRAINDALSATGRTRGWSKRVRYYQD